jgi:hypothetical protein
LVKSAKTVGKEAIAFAVDQAKSAVLEQVDNFINQTPFAVVKDILMFDSGDRSPIVCKWCYFFFWKCLES